jgi:glycosyltransferase involved in cell wall biosynthesis
MPSIEGGGVEKNLIIISDYFVKKIKNIKLISAENRLRNLFNKKISFISPSSKFSKNKNKIFKYLICLFLLFKEYLKNKNILIFAFQANIYAIIFAKILNIKIITRSNSSPLGWSKNSFKNILFKFFLPMADEIIVNSYDFKRQMDKEFNLNTKLIFNPLDRKKIAKLKKEKIKDNFFLDKKNFKILNAARLTNQKDHMTLLKAFKIVNKKIKSKLLIIGSGKNKTIIEHYIHKNNLHHSAKLISFQKNPYKYMNASDLFVLTSKFEGLPNVLLEALSLKKFVISANCPTGPSEILLRGKAGYLFETGNYIQLAKKILTHYKNKKKNMLMTNCGYLSLSRYDYKKNCEKYLNLILGYLENEC